MGLTRIRQSQQVRILPPVTLTERDNMKFRKKSVAIKATQWFKNGDHPEDKCVPIQPSEGDKEMFLSEGKVVRYYRTPECDGQHKCMYCNDIMHNHGWIDTMEGGHIVCPGDWIITGIKGEFYPIKDHIFKETYEALENYLVDEKACCNKHHNCWMEAQGKCEDLNDLLLTRDEHIKELKAELAELADMKKARSWSLDEIFLELTFGHLAREIRGKSDGKSWMELMAKAKLAISNAWAEEAKKLREELSTAQESINFWMKAKDEFEAELQEAKVSSVRKLLIELVDNPDTYDVDKATDAFDRAELAISSAWAEEAKGLREEMVELKKINKVANTMIGANSNELGGIIKKLEAELQEAKDNIIRHPNFYIKRNAELEAELQEAKKQYTCDGYDYLIACNKKLESELEELKGKYQLEANAADSFNAELTALKSRLTLDLVEKSVIAAQAEIMVKHGCPATAKDIAQAMINFVKGAV